MSDATTRDLFPGALEMMVLRLLKQRPMMDTRSCSGSASVAETCCRSKRLLYALQRLLKDGLVDAAGVSSTNAVHLPADAGRCQHLTREVAALRACSRHQSRAGRRLVMRWTAGCSIGSHLRRLRRRNRRASRGEVTSWCARHVARRRLAGRAVRSGTSRASETARHVAVALESFLMDPVCAATAAAHAGVRGRSLSAGVGIAATATVFS